MNAKKNEMLADKSIELVKEMMDKGYSVHRIAKDTNIGERTLESYINGYAKPTRLDAKILLKYFYKLDIRDYDKERHDMKERISAFLSHLNIGQVKFAEKIGVSRGYVNNMTNNPTQRIINKMLEAYPDLNINWLLTGEGQMLNTGNINVSGRDNIGVGNNNSIHQSISGNNNNTAGGHNVVINGNGDKKIIRQDEKEIEINRWENAERMLLQKIAGMETDIARLEAIIDAKDETINVQSKMLDSLNKTIEAKDEIIKMLSNK